MDLGCLLLLVGLTVLLALVTLLALFAPGYLPDL